MYALAFSGRLIPAWGVFALEQSEYSAEQSFKVEREGVIWSLI